MIDQILSRHVQARAIKDAGFRQALVSHPREVLSREFNLPLAETVTIRVVEDTPNTLTLLLPPQEISFEELSDVELEEAANANVCVTTTDTTNIFTHTTLPG
ncbi:MAG TPA: NHLP leader peptide family RiPP precursor [Ktedonobacterales bacterium]